MKRPRPVDLGLTNCELGLAFRQLPAAPVGPPLSQASLKP